jgi:predicted nucleic acid-binding protein
MVNVLFDTNILIDYLSGLEEAREEIERYADRAISLISWMEVMVGAGDQDAPIIKAFLSRFAMLPIDSGVAAEAVRIRRQRKIKLPDAIILASARLSQRLLITRNVKDFPLGADGEVRMPYTNPTPWRDK